MNKTFIFDIDGTLLSDKWEILPESIKALQEIVKTGNQFILASGRPVNSLRTIAEKLPVKPIFLIGSNGSSTYDFANKKIYRERKIPQEFINSLINHDDISEEKLIFQKHEITFGYNLESNDYNNLKKFSISSTTAISKNEINNLGGVSMIGLMGWSSIAWPKYKKFINKLVKKHRVELTKMETYDFINIFPGSGSKGQALSLLSIEGIINRKTCYAFGDGLNDIEMFKFAEYSYAMGQSSPEVKYNAKFVISNNNEASIANKVFEILKK